MFWNAANTYPGKYIDLTLVLASFKNILAIVQIERPPVVILHSQRVLIRNIFLNDREIKGIKMGLQLLQYFYLFYFFFYDQVRIINIIWLRR